MLTHVAQIFSSLPVVVPVFGAIGFVTVWLLVPLVIARSTPFLARRREFHQTHAVPVPRFGGVALVAAFVLVTVASFAVERWQPGNPRFVIGVTSLAMFALGLWDDISPLGARKKLLGQILIAVAAFYLGLKVETFKNPITGVVYSLGSMSLPATVFWLVALTNLINLIDGIDGLAAGISLMLMGLLVYVGFHGALFSVCIAVGMAGALAAFLRFNFPPARIYLGDGGAYFLGYLIGGLAIQNSNKGTIAAALIAPIFALALPILDVSFSIIRRGLKGLPIFRPDRRHIHHRLLHEGWSQRRAVLTLYAISLVFLALAFVAFWSDGKLTPILFGCGFVMLLLIVPNLGMIKNWFTVGTALGNSLEMRKEIQYALLLRSWIQMESERTESVEALWEDFTLAVRKLGFAEATLTHRDASCLWSNGSSRGGLRAVRHDLHITGETVFLDLFAPRQMEEKLFQIKGELIAETWQNAARRWTERNNLVFALPATEEKENAVAGGESVTCITA
jgi:UDP-GlcNAc:undecaprenyl-phosphate GlcNAc-1-phosphate transferase